MNKLFSYIHSIPLPSFFLAVCPALSFFLASDWAGAIRKFENSMDWTGSNNARIPGIPNISFQ